MINPRKQFQFKVTFVNFANIAPFHVQKLTQPDMDVEQVEHGEGNTVIKTAGMVKTGNLKIERIIEANDPSNAKEIFTWLKNCQNARTQTGSIPDVYKGPIEVKELNNAGQVVNVWYYTGCWPTKINGKDWSRTSSDNSLESVEFSVDYVDDEESVSAL